MNKGENIVFLYLIDFSKESYDSLNYLIKVAKKVSASIELFFVSNELESSVSGETEENNALINRKLQSIKELVEVEDVPVFIHPLFADLKNELENKSKTVSSKHIVVFNKVISKYQQVKTGYLIRKFKGNVLVLNGNDKADDGGEMVISCRANSLNKCDLKFPIDYCSQEDIPLKVLQLNYKEENELDHILTLQKNTNHKISYETTENSKLFEGLKEYVNKNDVNMVCINRETIKGSFMARILSPRASVLSLVNDINRPVLIMGK